MIDGLGKQIVESDYKHRWTHKKRSSAERSNEIGRFKEDDWGSTLDPDQDTGLNSACNKVMTNKFN